jgi:integrase
MFLLMFDAGTGPGATFAMTWGDIDTDRRTVSVSKSLEEIAGRCRVKATKTKHRNRTVTISPATTAALVKHRERMRTEGRSVAKDALAFCGSRAGGFLRSTDVRRDDWLPILESARLP